MAAAALVAGTALSAYGAISAGQAKKEAYEQQAMLKRAQAYQVDLATQRDVDLTWRKYQKVRGAQISSFSRSGVQLSGSPLQQLEETAANVNSELGAIKSAGAYRKSSLLTEAGFDQKAGSEAETAGYIGGLSSLLSGIGNNPYLYDEKKEPKPKPKKKGP